jgi:hypothetical protein
VGLGPDQLPGDPESGCPIPSDPLIVGKSVFNGADCPGAAEGLLAPALPPATSAATNDERYRRLRPIGPVVGTHSGF